MPTQQPGRVRSTLGRVGGRCSARLAFSKSPSWLRASFSVAVAPCPDPVHVTKPFSSSAQVTGSLQKFAGVRPPERRLQATSAAMHVSVQAARLLASLRFSPSAASGRRPLA
jgi:hypothetical protein